MQYVVYERSESGIITRVHKPVQIKESARVLEYPHAEKLLGWAERVVYWNKAVGAAVGVAQ